jgi:hypothetical protein
VDFVGGPGLVWTDAAFAEWTTLGLLSGDGTASLTFSAGVTGGEGANADVLQLPAGLVTAVDDAAPNPAEINFPVTEV